MPRTRLGLDLGSAAAHAALVDSDDRCVWSGSRPSAGRPLRALQGLLADIPDDLTALPTTVAVTGGARDLVLDAVPDGRRVNDVVATARGVAAVAPDARGVIEIGGHMSRWIALEDGGTGDLDDFALSELCAAGAGVFLEQQADRLRLPVSELGRLAAAAPRGATVAGRCAVFAKSDMIHLQQKGTPISEIAYGLCLALARSFQSSVLRGRELLRPAVLVGGGAANPGLLRALREVLGLDEDELQVAPRFGEMGALGAALLLDPASDDRALAPSALHDRLADGTVRDRELPRFAPLPEPGVEPPQPEPRGEDAPDGPLLLGVDVGSVSTDLVLLDGEGRLVDAVYLPTRGRPLEVLEQGIATLAGRHTSGLLILGVGTTGSGRHLAGRMLGADLVRNEITAQLRAAAGFMPRIDTVLEIGGQDSKYISASDGHILDFTMNKVCAAGTGSFLEEQATRLGISIVDEFAERALAATAPVDLGSRCTVFMDSELAHALRAGASTDDLAAGLALAVARNYLDKVVAGRPVGKHVLFQGGTASNRAVVAAFHQLLGRPVRVHPFNRLSGAIGAALLVLDGRGAGELPEESRFRGLGACQGQLEKSFECPKCSNRCQVNRFRSAGEVFFFGDNCERFSARGGGPCPTAPEGEHALELRQRWLLEEAGIESDAGADGPLPARALGIPRANIDLHLLPVWSAMARAAGRVPVLSPPSASSLLSLAQRRLQADTCLPVKMMYGHVEALRDRGFEEILVPAVASLPRGQNDDPGAATCPFTRHLPWMILEGGEGDLVIPQLRLDETPGRQIVDPSSLAARLGTTVEALERSLAEGLDGVRRWQARVRMLGDEILERAADRVLVIIGRSYNLGDRFLNMDLGRQLTRLGLPMMPMDALPLDRERLGRRWDSLVWASNRDYVRAALRVRRDPRLFPVVLSSFGCGPDGFTLRHIEELLGDRPRLFLELDEHRGEAGFVTRLEAFADEIDAHLRRRERPAGEGSEPVAATDGGGVPAIRATHTGRLILPYFADHAHAFAGALRRGQQEVVLLPPPDTASRLLGESLTSGRECHPFTLLAGDLARAVHDGLIEPGDSFFFPGGINACLYSQYIDGLRHVLRRVGAHEVKLMAPDLVAMRESLGLLTGVHLWHGVVAADLLVRASCELRPYERRPGTVDRVHQGNLEQLAIAVQLGEVIEFLPPALQRLRSMARCDCPRRPRIGVAGDIYTRINPFASGDLFGRLEELGCEVWPAPFLVDNAEFNLTRRLREAAANWDMQDLLSRGLISALKDLSSWRLYQALPAWAGEYREPDHDTVLELAAPYVGEGASPLLKLNLAKMVDFARGGAAGVLNAICFGCMLGGVSAAIMDRLRRDHGGIPMATLTFGGTEGTDGSARLETFVHQARRFHERRQDAGTATAR